MRIQWLVAALLLAGCVDGTDAPEEPELSNEAPIEAALPAPIHHEGAMPGVIVPVAGVWHCLDACEASYPFEVPEGRNLTVTVKLVSVQGAVSDPSGLTGVEADYDLEVQTAGGKLLGESYNFGYDPDVVNLHLSPGMYQAVVVTYQDVDGSFTLDISFEAD